MRMRREVGDELSNRSPMGGRIKGQASRDNEGLSAGVRCPDMRGSHVSDKRVPVPAGHGVE